jgi:hypothetical protein
VARHPKPANSVALPDTRVPVSARHIRVGVSADLTPEEMTLAFVEHGSGPKAARAIGVSLRTWRRWTAKHALQVSLEAARRQSAWAAAAARRDLREAGSS